MVVTRHDLGQTFTLGVSGFGNGSVASRRTAILGQKHPRRTDSGSCPDDPEGNRQAARSGLVETEGRASYGER